ncbi:MAG: thiamine-phosphate kinase [Proteobacteria bacterium]|nr:thiamine-phosphate kinase [Pseudomonadota bacterium]
MNREFELIDRLCKKLSAPSKKVFLGIGDDAAVLEPISGKILLTVDALVEGIHFDFSFCAPKEVGKKSLAVNVSDIVAMGGKPLAALISLGVSNDVSEAALEQIYEGIADFAQAHSIDVVGGNVTSSPERLMLSVTLLGEAQNRPLTRSGACEGDVVFISGTLGEAAAGLFLLKREGRKVRSRFPKLTSRYLTPQARTDLVGLLTSEKRVHSLIDVSDGLSSELWHLAKASKVGFLIEEDKIPVSEELRKASQETKQSLRNWQLSGGEDYELLGTCSPTDWLLLKEEAQRAGGAFTQIGSVVSFSRGVLLKDSSGRENPISPSGWNHLSPSERD